MCPSRDRVCHILKMLFSFFDFATSFWRETLTFITSSTTWTKAVYGLPFQSNPKSQTCLYSFCPGRFIRINSALLSREGTKSLFYILINKNVDCKARRKFLVSCLPICFRLKEVNLSHFSWCFPNERRNRSFLLTLGSDRNFAIVKKGGSIFPDQLGVHKTATLWKCLDASNMIYTKSIAADHLGRVREIFRAYSPISVGFCLSIIFQKF